MKCRFYLSINNKNTHYCLHFPRERAKKLNKEAKEKAVYYQSKVTLKVNVSG